ncbi:2-succinyl-6-hydroxy-2,4-cyclohexadiene-1-carboxylate synthase [Planktothrix paucivesiculata]|uniref:Putative 2-succinyl-6-hydroxy-2,4-cyclohexadiene-1-carboxylate synthase n=1 Tax=Planktothrix paucivesiculata PCC 9631 TaxID=671071 RepID=A0A7Z9BT58_9CYAN|nr:2-succinyl-6-hydroxy-2,4-cyclohexadiene-1-carboxylate synthase [Planktothrix paucivesiculata]VXD22261.1 2-succinyl-6-hydroxy-2, 4-cyclohexadiene-1-carboxylate synthase [Planktothrix paucivesiculata PCC 9631]
MPFLKLKNYNFYYTINGNINQPIILFLHGFLGNSQDFNTRISPLFPQFCCLTLDLPGHGQTQVLGEDIYYKMPETAAALIEVLNHLNISQCYLMGYSMGGRLGLYLTLHFPQYFKKVVLESTSPGLKTESERVQRLISDTQKSEQLETLEFPIFLEQWYHQPLFHTLKNHPEFDKIFNHRLNNNPLGLSKSLRYLGTGNQPSLWEKLPTNQIPLLLLVGELDHKFKQINQEINQLCPVSWLQIIPNCGHNILIENPQQWINVIVNFLSE